MKKCSCGSYAVNIERFTGDNCDVCHYKKQAENLKEELETLRASNTIKQGNIELLEAENAEMRECLLIANCGEHEKARNRIIEMKAENASLKDELTIAHMDGYAKAQDKIRELEAENAKLIAERDDVRKTYVDAAETFNSLIGNYLSKIEELRAEREAMMKQSLAVFFGKMPESNGKTNWTAILYRKNSDDFMGGVGDGYTLARSEYEDRVRYDADCVRYLIGEIDKEPFILDYDTDKHSGYVDPLPAQQIPEITLPLIKEALVEYFGHKCPDHDADCKCCQAWSQFEAMQAKHIPEGYALVPIEPTDEMDEAYTLKSGQSHLSVIGYKAMLSASQPKDASMERPVNCRNRLRDEGKAYPRSGCSHCKTGGLTGCPFDKPKGE